MEADSPPTFHNEVTKALRAVAANGCGGFAATFVFDAGAAVFRGHFPGQPLVPGVMEIEMVRAAYERHFGLRSRLRRVVKAKFTGKGLPDRELVLEARSEAGPDDTVRVRATLRDGATALARIDVVLDVVGAAASGGVAG